MKIKLHYKAVIAFALCINQLKAQDSFGHTDTIHATRNIHSNFWSVIILILISLLIFCYFLTKAIDKRANKN
jgi:hypothetical protein